MQNDLKVLIVTHYFWPENLKINDVAAGLVEKGCSVSVLTGLPNYPGGKIYKGFSILKNFKETFQGITIYRAPIIPRGNGSPFRLALNYLSTALSASIRLLFIPSRFDSVLVYGASPVTTGIPAIVAKYRFKVPIYFWIQDLWPESISAAGGVTNKYILLIVGKLTKFIYGQCHYILVQSKAFIPFVVNQEVANNKIIYLPNSTESFYKSKGLKDKYRHLMPKTTPIFMFAGNIGEAQGFNVIIESAVYLRDRGINISWIIIGDGRLKEYLAKRILELGLQSNVLLFGSYPSEEMPHFFVHADALIVTLKKNFIFSLTIPNKIQSYMASSKPIIASLDGEGGRVLLEAGCGLVSSSGDFMSFSQSAIEFLNLPEADKLTMGKNGKNYFDLEFDRDVQLSRLQNILMTK